jgi:hypothetical protein
VSTICLHVNEIKIKKPISNASCSFNGGVLYGQYNAAMGAAAATSSYPYPTQMLMPPMDFNRAY